MKPTQLSFDGPSLLTECDPLETVGVGTEVDAAAVVDWGADVGAQCSAAAEVVAAVEVMPCEGGCTSQIVMSSHCY